MNNEKKSMFQNKNSTMTEILNNKIVAKIKDRQNGVWDLISSKRADRFQSIQQDLKKEIISDMNENNMYIDNHQEFDTQFLNLSTNILETYIKFFQNSTITPDDLVNLYFLNSKKYSSISFCPICNNIVIYKDHTITCMNYCYSFNDNYMNDYSLDNILELIMWKYKEHKECNAGVIKLDLLEDHGFMFLCGNCLS